MAQIKYNLGDLGKEKYSTEEIAIGTWIDGKTIYRKCIVNNGSFSSKSNDLSVDLSNVDRIIDFHGTGIFNSNFEFPMHYVDNDSYFDVYRNIQTNTLYVVGNVSNKAASITKAFIFMDYTKITE